MHNNNISDLPKEIGNLENLSVLNLSFNCLTRLPDEICQLNLVELHSSGNQLQQLPENIGKLDRLCQLDLSDNKLQILPTSISELKCLQKLNLSKNQFISLDNIDLKMWSMLTELFLADNQITCIGEIHLPNLKILDLKHNRLTTLTMSLYTPELRDLCISFNQLSDIASNIMNSCICLEKLDLRDNQIHQFPQDILSMKHLKRLDLTNNNISKLPGELGLLEQMNVILLFGNPLRGLPSIGGTARLLEVIFINNCYFLHVIFSSI